MKKNANASKKSRRAVEKKPKRHRYRTRLINPIPTSGAVVKSMKANRPRDTGPELLLRSALHRAGIGRYRLHPRKVPGRPDIVFPRHRLAVFIHGCFWHRCPHCGLRLPKRHRAFWRRKFQRNRYRDRRKIAELKAAGYKVALFWECRIRKNPEALVRLIARLI